MLMIKKMFEVCFYFPENFLNSFSKLFMFLRELSPSFQDIRKPETDKMSGEKKTRIRNKGE